MGSTSAAEFTDAGGDRQRGSHREVERQQLERGQLAGVADHERPASSRSPSPAARSTPVARSRTRGTATPTTSRSGTATAGSRSARLGRRSRRSTERQALQIIGPDPLRRRRVPGRRGHRRPPTTCSRATWPAGAPSATTVDPAHPFSGPVYALTATATGRSTRADGSATSRTSRPPTTSPTCLGGTWHAMGAGGGPAAVRSTPTSAGSPPTGPTCTSARTRINVAGIPRPTTSRSGTGRHGAPWAPTAPATNGWFPASDRRSTPWPPSARTSSPQGRSRTRTATPRADNIAFFDGTAWHPVGSNGAGNGPWVGAGLRPRDHRPAALCGRELHQRRRRHPGAVRRLVRALAGHRLPDAHGDRGPEPGGDAHGDAGPERGATPTVTPAPDTTRAQDAAPQGDRSTRRSARRRSGSPPASRAPSSRASSTRRSSSPAPRRRPTRSSSPASTCSGSRRATAPATSTRRRWSSGSRSSGRPRRPSRARTRRPAGRRRRRPSRPRRPGARAR